MTAADLIYTHILHRGQATRPEMEALFHLTEKTVDSAIRKLERLGYIKRNGMQYGEGKVRPSVIFALTEANHDLRLIGDCRGRPAKESNRSARSVHSFDALTEAMNCLFGRRAA